MPPPSSAPKAGWSHSPRRSRHSGSRRRSSSHRPFGVERASEAAKLLEHLGYGTWWIGASPRVPDVRPVLEATSRLVAATGILNVSANEPAETAAATAAVRADFPGRLMLGI